MKRQGLAQAPLLETKATNTGENATYSYELMQKHGIGAKSLLIVTKRYRERRAQATFEAQWPDREVVIHTISQPIEFDQYCHDDQPRDTVINIMVGDLQRIIEYPALGYQSYQAVPDLVQAAYMTLIAAGYSHHLRK